MVKITFQVTKSLNPVYTVDWFSILNIIEYLSDISVYSYTDEIHDCRSPPRLPTIVLEREHFASRDECEHESIVRQRGRQRASTRRDATPMARCGLRVNEANGGRRKWRRAGGGSCYVESNMREMMGCKEGWKCECFATLPIRGCEASVSGLPPRGSVVRLGPSRHLGMKTSGPPPYVMTERTHSRLNSPCGSAC